MYDVKMATEKNLNSYAVDALVVGLWHKLSDFQNDAVYHLDHRGFDTLDLTLPIDGLILKPASNWHSVSHKSNGARITNLTQLV